MNAGNAMKRFNSMVIFNSVVGTQTDGRRAQLGRRCLLLLWCTPFVAASFFLFGCQENTAGLKSKEGIAMMSKPRRETPEWCNIWVTNANKNDMPRVLMIGDSITQAYYPGVEERLQGKACCARLTTSASVCDPAFCEQLESVLNQYDFQIIHFNNGLHGMDYNEREYRIGFNILVERLQTLQPKAILICALSTPFKPDGSMASYNIRVDERNSIVSEITKNAKISINDIHKPMQGHPEYYSDPVHYKDDAVGIQVEQTAGIILRYLDSRTSLGK